MSGRKPTPRAIKVARGNPGKRPLNDSEPTPSSAQPEPPLWLPENAVEHFNTLAERLAELRILTRSHTEAMAIAALRMAEIVELSADVAQHGRTYQTTTQTGAIMHRTRPEVAQLSEAQRHLQSLLSEFGLTPSASTKVTAAKPPARTNPFLGLIKGGKKG